MDEKPHTHAIDVDRALRTLSCHEMVALARMYERWALSEHEITSDQRTQLIQWSSDYEQIAEFAGPKWEASAPEVASDPIVFIARLESRALLKETK